ncbi:DUF6777 domain-containing protein [Kitasatospora sp. NPDC059327]|uniref:DUF6777 domain-containing protein n=1 Tax=Kitasatospora sp. NPDC059327 TaxID=3346803 RepID=UPI003692AE8B
MSSQPPTSGPPTGPPSGPPSGPLSGPPSSGPPGPPSVPPSGPGGSSSGAAGGPGGGRPTPWWRSGKKLALAAGTAGLAVLATVLIVNSTGGGGGQATDAIPAANEVALQSPSDPGAAPFTQSVETTAVSAPQPTTAAAKPTGGTQSAGSAKPTGGTPGSTATSPAGIHTVQGSSAGLYAGAMSKPACDTEKLISMTSTGDTGRAWASAQGIEQSAIPSYMRSLTSAYLRVDTRVTNHGYKGGVAVAYQSVLQAGTSVLVDAQGVPRVRCGCGNPLKPPELVSDAKYTGKSWTGFQPTSLVIVVAAPKPVTEFVLVNIDTGGWFARVTGQIRVEDRPVVPPRDLAPGIPPAAPMPPVSPSASVSGSTSASTSGSGSASTSGAGSGSTSGSTGPSTGSASASSSSGSPSGPSSSASNGSASASSSSSSAGASSSSPPGSSGPSTASAKPSTASVAPSTATATANTATATTNAATATGTTTSASRSAVATATCATLSPSTLPPCVTPSGSTPS